MMQQIDKNRIFLKVFLGTILCLCICSASVRADCAYQRTIQHQKPVVYYRFNDAVLNGDFLTNSGSYFFTNGVYYPPGRKSIASGAVTNDAASWFAGKGRRIKNAKALNPWPEFSVEVWAMYGGTQVASNGYGAIAGSFSSSGPRGWVLYANNEKQWEMRIGGEENGSGIVAGGTVSEDVWTHLVGTYDGVSICLYENGVLVARKLFYGGVANVINDAQALFGLGCRGDGSYFSWLGGIDEFALYSQVLDAQTIVEHYEARTDFDAYRKGVLELEPLVYWRLNEPDIDNSGANSAPEAEASTGVFYYDGAAPSVLGPRYAGFEDTDHALCLTNASDYVEFTLREKGASMDHWTFTAWVAPSDTQYQDDYVQMTLLSHALINSQQENFCFYNWMVGNWAYRWGEQEQIELPVTISRGTWSYMALLVAPEEVVFWQNDGTNEFLTSITNQMVHCALPLNGRFRLGAGAGTDTEIVENNYRGWMDECALFDRVLTESEIRAQFDAAWNATYPVIITPVLNYSREEDKIILSWSGGTLARLRSLDGEPEQLPEAVSPMVVSTDSGQMYYIVIGE